MEQNEILRAIIEERQRQDKLHPANNIKDYLTILVEEVGEVAAALQGEGILTEELIQVAAVCIRWIEAYEK
jgi:NTP pyrophosphatase (non-canonical NTP hydrolase)